ncbi:hypothetical protein [Photorhabdus tasmaniensis]|uniref:hypothetical protein n=1 Tax=Photorhabdus tasmaniensis TaxID=1004159 RepID=UPI001A9966AA|nr:hypothetical protein [Photorhabdus tasmaniensis]
MIFGAHQRRILDAGQPKEAELICRKGIRFFNLVVEQTECSSVVSDKTLGVDIGENNLAAHSLWQVFWRRATARTARPSPCPPMAAKVQNKSCGRSLARR